MVQSIFCSSNLLTQVSSLVCDDDGNVYASNFTSNATNIIKIDTNGNATQLTSSNIFDYEVNHTGMVYVNGYLYVTGYNRRVYKVNIVGGGVTTFVNLPSDNTTGITYYNESLYVVCNYLPTIYKVNMDGTYSVFITQNLSYPTYITNDIDGNFYITDNGSILKYNNLGLFLKDFNNTNFAPNGIISTIIYYNNYLYGTSLININYISKYDLNGNLITHSYAIGGSTIFRGGIAFDKNGNFYVSNYASYGSPYTIETIRNAESSSSSTTQTSSSIANNQSNFKIMPMKDSTSDNQGSFSLYRQYYIRTLNTDTTLINNSIHDTLTNNVQKKYYGNSSSKDSMAVLQKRVRNAIGDGSINTSNLSFTAVKDVNTTRNALNRVRNNRSNGIAKKENNYPNVSII